jgi:uncharacterized protein YndB with AHSA1/START domain
MSTDPESTSKYGTLTEVEGKPALRLERNLDHPVEKVWDAITDPDQAEKWLPERTEVDWAVGAEVRFIGPDGEALPMTATVAEYDPPRVVATQWDGNMIRYELEPQGDGCAMTVTHVFEDRESVASMSAGWELCLGDLDILLSGKEPNDGINRERWIELNEKYSEHFGVDPEVGLKAFEQHHSAS